MQSQIKNDFHHADKDAGIAKHVFKAARPAHPRRKQVGISVKPRRIIKASLRDDMRAGFHRINLRRHFGAGILSLGLGQEKARRVSVIVTVITGIILRDNRSGALYVIVNYIIGGRSVLWRN